MKRFSILCIMVMLFTLSTGYAYSDIDMSADYAGAVERMGAFGVLNGYGDGTFRPSAQITREEFAKVVVCAIDREETAMSCGYTSTFSDVLQGQWSVPYINYVAMNKIVTGYADGTFQPENNITYAEAATIILRIMGYNENDLGHFWPNNYVDKANSMLLANSVVADYNAYISRATAAVMVDNALFGKVNSSAPGRENGLGLSYQKDATVLEAVGYQIKEDVFVVATKNEDKNIAGNKVRTTEGTFETDVENVFSMAGKFGTAIIDKDDKICLFMPTETRSMNVIVDKVTGNQVEYTLASGSKGIVTLEKGFAIYDAFEKTSFDAVGSKLTQGSALTLYGDSDDGWSLGMINSKAGEIIPVVASHDYTANDNAIEGTPVDKSTLIVYRDSKTATLSDIRVNDVIYYNKGANIAEVFCKTVTGIYYEAKPSKAYVESIVLGNIEYNIATTDAKSKLDANANAFELGSRITLLLGKNDEIVGVISNEEATGEHGILLNITTQVEADGEARYVAKIFTKNKQTVEIITDRYYDDMKGELIKITYKDGVASLTQTSSSIKISNTLEAYLQVDKNLRKIGDYSVTQNTLIVEEISNNFGSDVEVEVVDFDFLEETRLKKENVKAISFSGKFGDIDILYVKNWTDASRNYGFVTSSKTNQKGDMDYNRQVVIFSDGKENKVSTSYQVVMGDVIRYTLENGSISDFEKLTLVKNSSKVEASEMGRIKVSGTVYETARNVMIIAFDESERLCRELSAEQLNTLNISNVKLYVDRGATSADLIKAIVVTEKK